MVNIIFHYQGRVLETTDVAKKKGKREIILSTNEATQSTIV